MLGGGDEALVRRHPQHPRAGARDPRRPARARVATRSGSSSTRTATTTTRSATGCSGRPPIWGHERCRSMLERFGERMRERRRRGGARRSRDDARRGRHRPARPACSPSTRDRLDSAAARSALALPRPRPHRQRHRGHVPDAGRPVRRRPASRTARRRTSATATRWTGRRRPRRCSRWSAPSTVVVPGHGDHAGRAFVEASLAGFRAVADAGAAGPRGRAATSRRRSPRSPTRPTTAREPLERARRPAPRASSTPTSPGRAG